VARSGSHTVPEIRIKDSRIDCAVVVPVTELRSDSRTDVVAPITEARCGSHTDTGY
jgi:hypothetical protein